MSVVTTALARLADLKPAAHVGSVTKVSPGSVVADGPNASVGDLCMIGGRGGSKATVCEVVAVARDAVTLMPLETGSPIAPGDRVALSGSYRTAPVGSAFGGRAVDALGQPIDGGAPIIADAHMPLAGQPLAPMARQQPGPKLPTGLACIDILAPIARGQRIGVFAAAGVGKTTLVRRLAADLACDRCILCLVGERGKEVEMIWRDISARPDAARFCVVASTSDQSASMRVRAVWQALCLAEYWRDQGQHVVLAVDSVTRFAYALREIGLQAGEPPTARAFTPNVFAALPVLVERCGAARAGGAITGVLSVLCETDDADDPIAEAMKSLLDGHIMLSRRLAAQGQWPAMDPLRSISREAHRIQESGLANAAATIVRLLAAYDEAQVMVESGVYRTGSNLDLDQAIRQRPSLLRLLAMGSNRPVAPAVMMDALGELGLTQARSEEGVR